MLILIRARRNLHVSLRLEEDESLKKNFSEVSAYPIFSIWLLSFVEY